MTYETPKVFSLSGFSFLPKNGIEYRFVRSFNIKMYTAYKFQLRGEK